MLFLKNKWLLLLLNLVLSFILFFVFAPQYHLLYFINLSFYIAGFYILLFIFLFIVNGRFFDGLIFGLRRFSRSKSKQKDYLDASEDKKLPSESINQTFYQLIAFQALTLLLMQIVLLTFYYVGQSISY